LALNARLRREAGHLGEGGIKIDEFHDTVATHPARLARGGSGSSPGLSSCTAPAHAISDAAQQIDLDGFAALMEELRPVAEASGREI
jgi:hypothetical protein